MVSKCVCVCVCVFSRQDFLVVLDVFFLKFGGERCKNNNLSSFFSDVVRVCVCVCVCV